MIGHRINVDGESDEIYYDTNPLSMRSLEGDINVRGDVFIELEIIRHETGHFKLYGYISGDCSFNQFEFEKWNTKGDVILLGFDLLGRARDVGWEHFNSLYCLYDTLDDFLIADELPIRLRDNEYNFNEDWIENDIENPYGARIEFTEPWMNYSDDDIEMY